jgi:DeoR/GlpR family transcriptional regulator of sugar metabolism
VNSVTKFEHGARFAINDLAGDCTVYVDADGVAAKDLRYRGAVARRERILDLVRESGFRTAAELSEALGVSQMTVRRDIHQLAEEGLVRSGYGGVSSIVPPVGGVDFQLRAQANLEAKRAIARHAARYVLERRPAVVALDAGTTVFEVLGHIPDGQRFTIVTHSLPVLTALSSREDIEVVALGGVLHAETQAFAGPATVAALEHIRVGTVLLAASAVRDGTMYCGNPFDAETKRALTRAADEVVLLADATKFSLPAVFPVGPVSEVDVVIVDDALSAAERESLERAGVRLELAHRAGP